MSAYLMSDYDTCILAAFAESEKLGTARAAATMLRSCNNAALAHRYGEKPAPLYGVEFTLKTARDDIDAGLTRAGIKDESGTRAHIAQIAREFKYQCQEGDVYETHAGGKLLARIIAKLEG